MTNPSSVPVVFIGGPFKAHVDPVSGTLEPRFRQRYERLIHFFDSTGWRVLNAHRAEGWGGGMVSEVECTSRDLAWMRECDLFVAFPGVPASPGTHVEFGWASALGKPAVVLAERESTHAALITGLHAVAPVSYVEYREEPSFLVALADAANDLADRCSARWRVESRSPALG